MKKIPLNKGKFTLIDDDDYERVSQYHWHTYKHCSNNNDLWYVQRRLIGVNGKKTTQNLHSFIMGGMTDHRDHDGLNNQKSNLRICTVSQNSANKRPIKHSSRFKGVSFYKRYNKWWAGIECNGKRWAIGTFKNEIDAALAYDAEATRVHGEFALTNKMLGLL